MQSCTTIRAPASILAIRPTSWPRAKLRARQARSHLSASRTTSPALHLRAELRAILAVIAVALAGLGVAAGAGGATWPDVLDSFGVSDGAFGLLNGIAII